VPADPLEVHHGHLDLSGVGNAPADDDDDKEAR